MAFTIIDGNIKLQMLPFLLKPKSPLNLPGDDYRTSDALYFTFRNNNTYMISGKGILNFCPKTMKDCFDKDISYQLTYKYNKDNEGKPTDQVTFDTILDNIPAIQIREYLPDTALEQAINFFVLLIKEVMGLFGKDGISTDTEKKKVDTKGKTQEQIAAELAKIDAEDNVFLKLWNVTWFLMKYITGVESTTASGKVATVTMKNSKGEDVQYSSLPGAATANYTEFNSSSTFRSSAPHFALILRFPHMLYYRLQSCTTTGIYELPGLKQDKLLYSSDGTPGWDGGDYARFSFLPKSLTSIPGISTVLNKMFGNIAVNWTPWWDANSGSAAYDGDIVILFDLFNDNNKSAIYNFIFVNTIVPNNKWIQYGLFQHSSHIYDIKLEGYNRLFACTGKFEVTYDGVLRDPPPNWLDQTGPLTLYLNLNIDPAAFFESLKKNKLIKIPDIYKVKMTFNSLLPSNFNNYLYTLVANDNHIDNNAYYWKTRDESQLAGALVNSFKGLLVGAKAAFTSGQDFVPPSLKIPK